MHYVNCERCASAQALRQRARLKLGGKNSIILAAGAAAAMYVGWCSAVVASIRRLNIQRMRVARASVCSSAVG